MIYSTDISSPLFYFLTNFYDYLCYNVTNRCDAADLEDVEHPVLPDRL